MKGIIFRAFEAFVVEQFGQEFYERVLESTPSAAPGVFVGPGTYPDQVLLDLVRTTVELSGAPLEPALIGFGRGAFSRLAATFPSCVTEHEHPIDLLQSIDGVIHTEVRKLYPEAVTPRIQVVRTDHDVAQLFYQSARRLCPVLIGLVQGACDRLGYAMQHTHPRCMQRGDAVCEFEMTFTSKERSDERTAVAAQAR